MKENLVSTEHTLPHCHFILLISFLWASPHISLLAGVSKLVFLALVPGVFSTFSTLLPEPSYNSAFIISVLCYSNFNRRSPLLKTQSKFLSVCHIRLYSLAPGYIPKLTTVLLQHEHSTWILSSTHTRGLLNTPCPYLPLHDYFHYFFYLYLSLKCFWPRDLKQLLSLCFIPISSTICVIQLAWALPTGIIT